MLCRKSLAILSVLGFASAEASASELSISNLRVIPLAAGPNHVDHFSRDGRPAFITLGWRDNGNAHGYDLFLVLMPTATGSKDWNVVGFESGDAKEADEDTIRDAPHTGDDFVRSVRFAHGDVGGKPATLVLTATRNIGAAGIPAAAPVDYEVFRLTPNERGFGTADYFQRIEVVRSATEFCNAELALSHQFDIPLPRDYAVPGTKDGC